MNYTLYEGDLPPDLVFGASVAVDTEAMGLDLHRDRLCLVQLSGGDGHAHLVRIARGQTEAPNLKALLEDPTVTKIFHYARFDLSKLKHWLGISCQPVYCTKIASRLSRTSGEGHKLRHLLKEFLGIEADKSAQTSDWGGTSFTEEQLTYAAADVLHLHQIKECLDEILVREERVALAQACFNFLPTQADLDVAGWMDVDIFSY